MKQLLNGVAIAAALVIAAPAFAQAPPTSPDMGKKASGGAGRSVGRVAPAPAAAPAAAAAPAQMHHRPMHHHMAHHGHMGKKSGGDAMTDQLNREELARIQGGAPGAPMPPPPGAGPRPSGH
ncbi:MAG TPA: hypothetical protein VKQ73_15845 [Stellaceae bacterium]|nr:hypothetical protein [Stellaceae bacterium]